MRVLVLARDLPFFPGGHGGNTRTFSLIRALAGRHRFTVVTNVYTAAHERAARELAQLVERVEYYRDPAVDAGPAPPPTAAAASRWRQALHLLHTHPARFLASSATYLRARLSWLPDEASLWELTFANLRAPLERALAHGPYDLLQIECSDNGRWVKHFTFRGPKVLVVQDVKTVFWWRRFTSATGVRERWHALLESARFLVYERRYLRRFDQLISMSDADRQHLGRLTGHPDIAVVPNGVDVTHYQPSAEPPDPKRVVFTATLDHPPNCDGILYFVRDIWPLIQDAEPDARLDIVGANPPPEIQRLASDTVRVTGFVPDIRPHIAVASVFICPLRFASGTRLKILEAMAMGKTVVSTSVGAEGIECTAGRDLFIADAPAAFARQVIHLLRDANACGGVGRAARAVAERYDWAQSAAQLDAVYTTVRRRYVAQRARRPLRVGLNGLFLVPGGQTGGLEPYFHNLVTNLLRLDHDTQYVLLANASNALEFATLRGDNLRHHVVPTTPGPLAALRSVARTLGRRALGLPAPPPPARGNGLARLDLDFVHSFPGYIHPCAWEVPSVLTVADIQHEFYPEFFDADELAARRALFEPSVRHARRIIAISDFTRWSLIDRYRIAPDKICVIPLGVDPRFLAPVAAGQIARLRRRHRLPDDYCVYPANLWPHKNHLRLLAALAQLAPANRPHLVLTGAATRTQIPLRDAIRERDLEAYVSWLGFVDAEDLPGLLAGARLMIFPSLFEGFGMPAVEAMAANCPVACADATALPEAVGNAALRFDPRDVDAIAAAIERLWRDADERERLRAAGRARARQFTWQRTALLTLQVYREMGAAVRESGAE